MNVIEVDELTKIYQTGLKKGSVLALDSANLTVREGEIFGLLGPNGAGKTTLMKVLLGIVRPTQGRARLMGLPPGNPESRLRVGYLPESHRFPFHLTGLGLLELTGRLHGMNQSDIDARAETLLPLVGMDRWANTKLKKYSKGMLQRIGLAQALIADPELVLLDEPTDGVDPVGKIEIREVLKSIRNEGKTIFLNSHLLSEVESVADRVAILSKGKVIRSDTVDSLTRRHSQYEIVAEMGNELIDIAPEMGKRISISSSGMILELIKDDDINHIIDQLRLRGIKIKSVSPMKVSLEQSFFEAVSDPPEETE